MSRARPGCRRPLNNYLTLSAGKRKLTAVEGLTAELEAAQGSRNRRIARGSIGNVAGNR
jgi:hypothetical protein